MASSSSVLCTHERCALVLAVLLIVWLLLHESEQVHLRAEVLQKESASLVSVGHSGPTSSAWEEHPQLPIQNAHEENDEKDVVEPLMLSPSCRLECRVTKETLRPFTQHPNLDYDSGSAAVIFLLGYPSAGTAALHFLLSTSGNVSTLGTSSCPPEEGWSRMNVTKNQSQEQDEDDKSWDGSLQWVDWNQLAQSYGQRWARNNATTAPLKVEHSPPEIQAPKALKETFEPIHGKVKFILLVQGDCTYDYNYDYYSSSSSSSGHPFSWEERAVAGYQKVTAQFPEDAFVVRLEDLCLSWDSVHAGLVRWEPLLADINSSTIPAAKAANGSHRGCGEQESEMSLRQYCESVAIPRWESGLPPRPPKNAAGTHLQAAYGYDKTNTCPDG